MTFARHIAIISVLASFALASIARDFVFSDPEGDISVAAAPGDKVKISLEENATTGYMWQCDTNLCNVESAHVPSDRKDLVGAPGRAEFVISPVTDGAAEVVLEYKRSWEKDKPPAKRICVKLNEKPAADNVKRVDDLLTSAGYFFLATVDGDQPKLRPLGAHFVADGKVIFGVGDFKNVYKQLVKNPKTEIVAMVDGKGKWLRYTGRVVFADGDALKRYVEMTFERMPGLRDIYNEKTGNNLKCFWLEDATAELINMMPPGEKIEL